MPLVQIERIGLLQVHVEDEEAARLERTPDSSERLLQSIKREDVIQRIEGGKRGVKKLSQMELADILYFEGHARQLLAGQANQLGRRVHACDSVATPDQLLGNVARSTANVEYPCGGRNSRKENLFEGGECGRQIPIAPEVVVHARNRIIGGG